LKLAQWQRTKKAPWQNPATDPDQLAESQSLLDIPEYNELTSFLALGAVFTKSDMRELPVGSPYCSDPNCAYCKELREFGEEQRRKKQSEEIKFSQE
jgi:hypothetical protein